MNRNHRESKGIISGRKWNGVLESLRFSSEAIVILLCGVGGLLISLVFSKIFSSNGLNIAGLLGTLSLLYILGFIIGALLLLIVLILQQYELAAIGVIGIHLYIDWYLGLSFVASILALFLLLYLFIGRHYEHQWTVPRALWLWILFLALAIFQTTKAPSFLYGADYYLNIIFDALIMLWIGILIARDHTHVRRFFQILSVIGTLIALHTIIETTTGIFLFQSSRNAANATIISYIDPLTPGVHRAESFLLATDTNGAFLALMFIVPLVLFTVSSSFLGKLLFIAEMFITLLALLFTYSTGAWLSAFVGVIVFAALVGRARLRIQIFLFLFVAGIVGIVYFPSQLNLLLYHATVPGELALRTAVWQTGIRVIEAYPLTGLGIGRDIYLMGAEAYRVPAQYISVHHPHNSFLEFAALGGLPVGIVFIALLSINLWLALRNLMHTDIEHRPLLAGGIALVIALSWFSLSDAGWTAAPLAPMGWLIAGIVASPSIGRYMRHQSAPPVDKTAEIVHIKTEISRMEKAQRGS